MKRWILPPRAETAVELAAGLGIGMPAARVLAGRGFSTTSEALRFLAPALEDLHDPYLLGGMRAAVTRLRAAIDARQTILIYGDYDVDGTTSVVVLLKAIELAGGTARFHVPHRLRDGYGMRPEVIEEAAAQGVRLIVSVDTGIRAAEVVRGAAELGIDVIITDHHLPDAELPDAVAVLNPNQPGCEYPDKNLCGVGVAFKLAQALLGTLGWPETKLARVMESFLKLVAIGTVADVVPLRGENRIFVKHGLEGLRSVKNPGLRAILDVSSIQEGRAPTAGQVGFRIGPRINAAGRMDTANAVIEMFLTANPARAREIAAELNELNGDRQQTEAGIVEEILAECQRVPVDAGCAALVFCRAGWHRGVLGIVASRLVERFHRPTFVLSEDDDGKVSGSGRSIPCFHLLNALEAMPELFTRFGGHEHAAGLTMPAANVAALRERFDAYAASMLGPEDFVPQLALDAELGLDEVSDRAVAEILALAPFGHGNPTPVFLLRGAEVGSPPLVWKEKHLKVLLRQNGRRLWLKAWNFAPRVGEFVPGALVDVALTLEEDLYEPWCAVLKDVRPAG